MITSKSGGFCANIGKRIKGKTLRQKTVLFIVLIERTSGYDVDSNLGWEHLPPLLFRLARIVDRIYVLDLEEAGAVNLKDGPSFAPPKLAIAGGVTPRRSPA